MDLNHAWLILVTIWLVIGVAMKYTLDYLERKTTKEFGHETDI